MTLLDLLNQDGIRFSRVSRDQFSSSCPGCGGSNRFCVWPDRGNGGQWWCRGCEKGGDAIEYLKEFRGMGYREACKYLGQEPKNRWDSVKGSPPLIPPSGGDHPAGKKDLREKGRERTQREKDGWIPKEISLPSILWREKAEEVLEKAERYLWLRVGEGVRTWLITERGLGEETIRQARLGCLPQTGYPFKLLIPTFRAQQLIRIRTRQPMGGYSMISGSCAAAPMILTEDPFFLPGGPPRRGGLGGERQSVILVESELDALLLCQEAGDLVTVVALGSVGIRPDRATFEILSRAGAILLSLDSDSAGIREAWGWWQEHFPQAKRWPVPNGKDPGEAWQGGLNLRSWTLAGLLLLGDAQEAFEERAGICEFEANLPRQEAERLALEYMR